MTDSLKDILGGKAKKNEPLEFDTIKRFVVKECNITPKLTIRSNNIIISIPGSSAAGALRLKLHELQENCGPKYKLIIRISR